MIPQTTQKTVESTVTALKDVAYHFDPRNMRHIAAILRDMYTDPVLAVVREYCANAVDAHVMSGQPHRPIEISVPTKEDSTLVIRDFGPGLNDSDTEALLLGYGASGDEKRVSNRAIGGFGIGAKCAHSITDQFTYTSYHNGRKTVWHCYRDEDDDCRAKKVSDTNTTEPSGILVSIPISDAYRERVNKVCEDAFLFYPVRPKVYRGSQTLLTRLNRVLPAPFLAGNLTVSSKDGMDIPIRWEAVKDPDYSEFTSRYGGNEQAFARVVMGPLAYPVDLEKVQVERGESEPFLRRIILHVPIGFLQLAPSRESLFYSQRVQSLLSKIFSGILETARTDLLKEVEKATTCAAKIELLRTLFHMLGPHESKSIQNLCDPLAISRSGYIVHQSDALSLYYFTPRRKWHNGNYALTWDVVNEFRPDYASITQTSAGVSSDRRLVVVRIPSSLTIRARELATRVAQYYGWNQQQFNTLNDSISFIFIQESKWDVLKKRMPWLDDGSVESLDYAVLPYTITPENMDLFAGTVRYGNSSVDGPRRLSYKQHSVKFNVLKDNVDPYSNPHSSNWKPAPVSGLDEGIKVYILHDRFIPVGIPITTLRRFCNLLLKTGLAPELEVSGLIGVRSRDKDNKALKDPEQFVSLQDYMKTVIARIVKKDIPMESLQFGAHLVRVYHRDPFLALMMEKACAFVDEDPSILGRTDEFSKALVKVRNVARPLVSTSFGTQVLWTILGPLTASSGLQDMTGSVLALNKKHLEDFSLLPPLFKEVKEAFQKLPLYQFLHEFASAQIRNRAEYCELRNLDRKREEDLIRNPLNEREKLLTARPFLAEAV